MNKILKILLLLSLLFSSANAGWKWDVAKAGAVVGAVKVYKAVKKNKEAARSNGKTIEPTYKTLRREGKKDAHHIIQDASVKQLPKYNRNDAPAMQLESPASKVGTEHHKATQVQRESGGGTYGAERKIGYKALRKAGIAKEKAREAIERADNYFDSIGVTKDTITKIPKNRKNQ